MTLPPGPPKFRRRKAERPDEIVAAALEIFAEKGFAAARLDDIAARAQVSKGAIYLYFATKEDIFRAVVEQAVLPNVGMLRTLLASHPGPFDDLVRRFSALAPQLAARPEMGGVIKMIIGEARNFPELARVWHDQVVDPALSGLTTAVEAAQARGEVRPGDARLYALGLVAPLLVSVLWRETFTPVGAEPFDLDALARQHFATAMRGMLEPAPG